MNDEDPVDVLHRREKERKKSWGMKDGKYLRPQHTIEADLASEEGRERHQETFREDPISAGCVVTNMMHLILKSFTNLILESETKNPRDDGSRGRVLRNTFFSDGPPDLLRSFIRCVTLKLNLDAFGEIPRRGFTANESQLNCSKECRKVILTIPIIRSIMIRSCRPPTKQSVML